MAANKDSRVSVQAVTEATGKNWDQWFEVLDKVGAAKLNHTRIAGYLRTQHDIKPWWSQTVANIYEQERGLREAGQTVAVVSQVGVRKTLGMKLGKAWDLLTRFGGLEVWLGTVEDFKLEAGFVYHTAEGVHGEVLVVSPGSHWRMTWQPAGWANPSTLQVRFMAVENDNTTVSFRHEGLPDSEAQEAMRERWQTALIELAAMA